MTDPSLAARDILDAYESTIGYRQGFAAVLRVVANQVAPKSEHPSGDWTDKDEIRCQLLAIAAEFYPT
jgi:hypothetical protein